MHLPCHHIRKANADVINRFRPSTRSCLTALDNARGFLHHRPLPTNNAKEFDCLTSDTLLKFVVLCSPTHIAVGATSLHRSPPVGVLLQLILFATCRNAFMTTRVHLFHVFTFSRSLPLDQSRSSSMTFPFNACFLNI